MWILKEPYQWTRRVGGFVNLGDEIKWHLAAAKGGSG